MLLSAALLLAAPLRLFCVAGHYVCFRSSQVGLLSCLASVLPLLSLSQVF